MTFPTPGYHQQEEFINRSRKVEELRALGIEPYPHSYSTAHKAKELALAAEGQEVGHYDDAAAGTTQHTCVSGRLVLFRPMGKNIFAQIQDETGRIQILFNRDTVQVAGLQPDVEWPPLKVIEKKWDLGDIIGIEGHIFRTQRGELTVFAKKATLLAKALLPLPDKHGGLADKGVLYRKRWLDLITHPESMERFRLRSCILLSIRRYFEKRGFEEVETAILGTVYGGAQARPFTTHLNALDQDMFLRISLEINLKKLIAGGMQRIYEIGKIFRNEGIDRTHNPEFTMLEAYAAEWDYNNVMEFTEKLFETIALDLFGDTRVGPVEFKAPWIRMTMKEAVRTYGNIDVDTLKDADLRAYLEGKGIDALHKMSRGSLIAALFETYAEKHLIQPHHIIDHPIETTPLCKPHRDPAQRKEGLVERFESFILGTEMCNAYSELNDPILQRELLVKQAEERAAGNPEASPLDEEFIEAVCQGMPPTGGVGIGIDRLVMLFTQAPSIRDVLFFPLMRPEE